MEHSTIVEQLSAALAKIEAISADFSKVQAERDALTIQLSESKATVDRLAADLNTASASITDLNAKLSDVTAKHAEAEKALKTATDRLGLAQFVDIGGTKPVTDGGDSAQEKSKADLLREYSAIKNSRDRAKFRNEHPKILEP